MDIHKAIQQLRHELDHINEVIASLEAFHTRRRVPGSGEIPPARQPKKRGRKSMPPEEREAARQRMVAYWEKRRAAKAEAASVGV